MLRIQAAGQNSPEVESDGSFRANHRADAPRVVALVVLYRMATYVTLHLDRVSHMACVWDWHTKTSLGDVLYTQAGEKLSCGGSRNGG